MYGPMESMYRPCIPEEVSNFSDLATHCSGMRSGLPLWGSSRTFGSPVKQFYDTSESVCEIDRTLCKTRARSLSPTQRERNALSYYDFVNDCHAQSDAQKEFLAKEFELERRILTRAETAANLRNTAMRIHHDDGNRLMASEIYWKSLENDPDNIECLNACGILLNDAGAIAKREKANQAINSLMLRSGSHSAQGLHTDGDALNEAQIIYTAALRWNRGGFEEPSMYSCMKRNLAKLTPTAIRGFKNLEIHKAALSERQSKARSRQVASWGIRKLAL